MVRSDTVKCFILGAVCGTILVFSGCGLHDRSLMTGQSMTPPPLVSALFIRDTSSEDGEAARFAARVDNEQYIISVTLPGDIDRKTLELEILTLPGTKVVDEPDLNSEYSMRVVVMGYNSEYEQRFEEYALRITFYDETRSSRIPIYTEADLQKMDDSAEAFKNDFILVNDIAFSGLHEPLVSPDADFPRDMGCFSGQFEGNNREIRNLRIISSKNPPNNIGFFSCLSPDAQVQNLRLVLAAGHEDNPSVAGQGNYVGVLVGINHGEVVSVQVQGGWARGNNLVGGLVGKNEGAGTIKKSAVIGGVMGFSTVGGLVGENAGTVTESYFKGKIIGELERVGGFVGVNGGKIEASFAQADVRAGGSEEVGGFAGMNSEGGDISSSYAQGTVGGNLYVGGFAGANFKGTIRNSYTRGEVEGMNFIGGFAGVNEGKGRIENSYAVEQVVVLPSAAVVYPVSGRFTGSNQSLASVKASYFLAPSLQERGLQTEVPDDVVLWSILEQDIIDGGRHPFASQGWSFGGDSDPVWRAQGNGQWPLLYWQD